MLLSPDFSILFSSFIFYMLFPGKLSSMSAAAVNLHAFPWEAFQHISRHLKSTCFSRNLLPSFLLFLNIHMLSPNTISIKWENIWIHMLFSPDFSILFSSFIFYMLFPEKLSIMSAAASNLHASPREDFHHISRHLKSTCFSPGSFPACRHQP